jgi:hypothetical protein
MAWHLGFVNPCVSVHEGTEWRVGKLGKPVPNKLKTTYRILGQNHIGLRQQLILKNMRYIK